MPSRFLSFINLKKKKRVHEKNNDIILFHHKMHNRFQCSYIIDTYCRVKMRISRKYVLTIHYVLSVQCKFILFIRGIGFLKLWT